MQFLSEAAGDNADEVRPAGIEGLMEEFQSEIAGNKTIILELSQFLGQQSDPSAPVTAEFVNEVAARVIEAMQRVSTDHELSSVGESSDQLGIALVKALKLYLGKRIANVTEQMLRDVSDIVYDAMVFNKGERTLRLYPHPLSTFLPLLTSPQLSSRWIGAIATRFLSSKVGEMIWGSTLTSSRSSGRTISASCFKSDAMCSKKCGPMPSATLTFLTTLVTTILLRSLTLPKKRTRQYMCTGWAPKPIQQPTARACPTDLTTDLTTMTTVAMMTKMPR